MKVGPRATSRRSTPELLVAFPAVLDANAFEAAIVPLRAIDTASVAFDYSLVTFVPLDVWVASLHLYNDLSRVGRSVTLRWANVSNPAIKYAERMGFFRLLAPQITVLPQRPTRGTSLYDRHKGGNALLLEMTPINVSDRETANAALHTLQTRLDNNLSNLHESSRRTVVNDLWTFSAEIIGNMYEHSETPVPGVVAAQRYERDRGPVLHLVLADSGLGIPRTLRRSRTSLSASDSSLIFTAFKDGLSRSERERGRGCGLTRCAAIAMRYQANLRVRTNRTWVKLITKSAKTGVAIGFRDDNAGQIDGTQISFDFYLDRLKTVT